MKNFERSVRIILGLVIIVSGANKFGYWINVSLMQDTMDFVVDLVAIGGGFLVYALGVLEILIGLALILDKFKLLAILGLIPLLVFVLAFHLFLDIKGIFVALIVFAMDISLLFIHKEKIGSLFQINSKG